MQFSVEVGGGRIWMVSAVSAEDALRQLRSHLDDGRPLRAIFQASATARRPGKSTAGRRAAEPARPAPRTVAARNASTAC